MAAKNPTQWTPPNRQGYVTNLGTLFLTDNSGNFLVDNAKNFVVTTPNLINPPNATAWTAAGAS